MALLAPASLLAPAALQAQGAAAKAASARVIVKYKADSPLLRKQAQSAGEAHAERAQALGERLGMTLRAGMGVAEHTQVLFASGMTSQALADRLSRESDVEFAVPDQRKQRSAVPNDPRYLTVAGASGPASGQWYLRAPQAAAATTANTIVSSINAEAAWDVTQGTASVVVAVLDSGIRFDHPDLKRVADGGNLLEGYDMLGDDTGAFAGTFASAGDGDGRDADPSDTGDWITQAEANDSAGLFYQCPVGESSWHGTQVAGLIGALTDNAIGMASVGRTVRLLPVRVLGRCGGYDSDILAGMRWAAGIGVPGVPPNPNPAKVINMSLGASGVPCTSAYQAAVSEIAARGVLIVASAGNSVGHALGEPANCPGVMAVGALRHVGTKVGFSDLGPEVALSAPGGNCVNPLKTDPCLYPILTTTNTGTQGPVSNAAGGSTYTSAFNPSIGTSFSAPLVSGTAALMLSVRPALTPQEIRLLLKGTARPFPSTGATNEDNPPTLQCTTPQYDSSGFAVDQGQCYCNKGACGAGMLDAAAAVRAASTGSPSPSIQARIDMSPLQPVGQRAITLTAQNTELPAGRTISSYAWTLIDGGGIVSVLNGSTVRDASVTPTGAGRFTIAVAVTDSANISSSTTLTVSVAPTPLPPPPPPPAPDSGGGGALGLGWLVALLAAVMATRRSTRRHASPL
jgi:serine protease